jgi:hypothetical protein
VEESSAAMAVVVEAELLLEGPLSPELVLVSPPEAARLARERLSTLYGSEAASLPAGGLTLARASFIHRNAGLASFYVFCVLATVGPLVLTILLGYYE